MANIFINYRREDSQWPADKLFEVLKRLLPAPAHEIFIDVDKVPYGIDFVDHLDKQVTSCDVLLAVIGRDWLTIADAKTGQRRLDNPQDFVRIEIEVALKRGVPVVPVLVDGATVPAAADLPDAMKPLSRRNGIPISRQSFEADVGKLVGGLNLIAQPAAAPASHAPQPAKSQNKKSGALVPVLAAIAILAAGGIAFALTDPLGLFKPKPQDEAAIAYFRDCESCPEMTPIPAGTYQAGAAAGDTDKDTDEASVSVTIDAPFAVGKYEVTWGEWQACVAASGCSSDNAGQMGNAGDPSRQPVVGVTWQDASGYAEWLASLTGKKYRLLSEAEWEYAARAGETGIYPFGSQDADFCKNLNSAGSEAPAGSGVASRSCSDNFIRSAPVGSFPANAFGLYDMLGNAHEWVADCYNPEGVAVAGTVFSSLSICDSRVVRGGGWTSPPHQFRLSDREHSAEGLASELVGFRVARSD